jgi:hypothetical protein
MHSQEMFYIYFVKSSQYKNASNVRPFYLNGIYILMSVRGAAFEKMANIRFEIRVK